MQPPLGRRRRTIVPLRTDPQPDLHRLSDPILVTRAKTGDERALAALCERHAPRVERLARHLLRDPEDARDAAQDALARVCARVHQFRGEAAFSTWVHRLTANACYDVAQRRHVQRCEPLTEDTRPCLDPAPAEQAELAELRAELRAGLAELPEPQARVLVLKDALGYSFEEIARTSGMPVGTAKCYAHRGRAGMRRALEPEAVAT